MHTLAPESEKLGEMLAFVIPSKKVYRGWELDFEGI
jgi:hypothetical protein